MSTENGTAGISRIDSTVGQPRWRSRASSVLTRGCVTSRSSCQPAARTSNSAATALIVLATTAMHDAEPWAEQQARGQRERGAREREHRDDDVRGQEDQREPWARPRSPSRAAAPRSGSGTSNATATRITIVATIAANLRAGAPASPSQITAARSACEGADDGLHVYQDYGSARSITARRCRSPQSAARRHAAPMVII